MTTVLIVDDTDDFRLLFSESLIKDQWPPENIFEAASGKEALEKFKEKQPDCILLDFNLPDKNALEIIESFKSGEDEVPCPIVVATGHGNETIAVNCMKAGAMDYIVKDELDQSELSTILKDAVEQFKLNSDIKDKLLEAETSLEKKNIALQEIMNMIETEKSKVLKNAFTNIETILLPIFQEIKEALPESKKKMAQHFEESLRDLSPSLAHSLTQNNSKLTPREIQICNLVNKGLASKEIAEQLDIAIETIAKHRYRIRRKLGLSKKSDRLSVYLHSLDKS